MKKNIVLSLFALILVCACTTAQTIRPLQRWLDTNGEQINVHGGGILLHEGTYYWYGEHRALRGPTEGVMCYSSKDLVTWKNEGLVFRNALYPDTEVEPGSVVERPKVIYNPKTKKFVMWYHLERRGQGYSAARACVAVSDSPTGNFKYLHSGRINEGKYPMDWTQERIDSTKFTEADYAAEWWTPEWMKMVDKGLLFMRDLKGGQMSRDQTLFVDRDGKAYQITSGEENVTLFIHQLNDDFTAPNGKFIRVAPGGHNEAPTIFIHNDTYWMITSGCTGWAPNEARMFSAPSIWGPWEQHPNPCKGEGVKSTDPTVLPNPNQGTAAFTFSGQSTFVLPVPQYGKDAFIFMADQWRPRALYDSRHLWLPIKFAADGKPELYFLPEWTFDEFKKN